MLMFQQVNSSQNTSSSERRYNVKYEKRDLESMRPILVECLLEHYRSHFEVPRVYKDPVLNADDYFCRPRMQYDFGSMRPILCNGRTIAFVLCKKKGPGHSTVRSFFIVCT
jgi:hypothetical protein